MAEIDTFLRALYQFVDSGGPAYTVLIDFF